MNATKIDSVYFIDGNGRQRKQSICKFYAELAESSLLRIHNSLITVHSVPSGGHLKHWLASSLSMPSFSQTGELIDLVKEILELYSIESRKFTTHQVEQADIGELHVKSLRAIEYALIQHDLNEMMLEYPDLDDFKNLKSDVIQETKRIETQERINAVYNNQMAKQALFNQSVQAVMDKNVQPRRSRADCQKQLEDRYKHHKDSVEEAEKIFAGMIDREAKNHEIEQKNFLKAHLPFWVNYVDQKIADCKKWVDNHKKLYGLIMRNLNKIENGMDALEHKMEQKKDELLQSQCTQLQRKAEEKYESDEER